MRRFFIGIISIVVFSIIICGCTNKNLLEDDPNTISELYSDENANGIVENVSEIFDESLPFHQGIWEVRSYDQATGWYEFSETYEGRKLECNEVDAHAFTYEIADNEQVIFHFDDGDTIAEYSFGEDGKIVTFSFEKEQITLFWISHGTLEDIGGLGLTFSVENITPKGCTVICQQSDGYVSGEIIADKSFDLMMLSGDSWGWSGLIGNKTDTVVIQKESNTEWVLDWSQYSENLRPGRYYLCFQVRDVRSKGGDWDSYQYRVELQINAE